MSLRKPDATSFSVYAFLCTGPRGIWWPSGTVVKEQNFLELASNYGTHRGLFYGLGALGPQGLEPNY
jgi:hypothetical protein